MYYVPTNVGSTFYVKYAFNLKDARTDRFRVHFPRTQSVMLFSKLPFGSYESLKSRRPTEARYHVLRPG